MHFNIGKYNVFTMPNSEKHHPAFYSMNGQIMQQVTTAKYLGITIHDSLDFTYHIRETVSKANKRLGFLKSNLTKSPLPMKKLAYISLVRSAMIWDPHLATQKKSIEKVQHRAIHAQ